MLIITRKPGQCLTIDLLHPADVHRPAGELFASGPLEIIVARVEGTRVQLGIRAHPHLRILREELMLSAGLVRAADVTP